MFTLKLFRRVNGQVTTKIEQVQRVTVHEVMDDTSESVRPTGMLELTAFPSEGGFDYHTYFVGALTPEQKEGRLGIDWLGQDNHSAWGWGLLENMNGKTTQHFRPASYG